MNHQTPSPRGRPVAVKNRLAAIMLHIPRYSCFGIGRLARDAGISPNTVSRLVRGIGIPHYGTLCQISDALSKAASKPIDVREVAVPVGTNYLTKYPCELFGCRCLPDWAYFNDYNLKPEWVGIEPGKWTYEQSEHLPI